jgi:hypothetical protein
VKIIHRLSLAQGSDGSDSEEVAALQAQVSTLQGQVSTLQTTVSNRDATIEDLEGEVEDLEGEVEVLEDQAIPPWTKLTTVSQSLGVPVDPTGIGTTGTSFNLTTGRATVVYSAHVSQVDGYQEGVLRWTYPLLSLYPDFDPTKDTIELGLSLPTFLHGTTEAGLFLGILDSATVDASLAGMAFAARNSTVATDQQQNFGPAGQTAISNIGKIDEIHGTIAWANDSPGAYTPQLMTRVLLEGTSVYAIGLGGTGQVMRSTLANWQLVFGAFHGSTDSTAGVVMAFDVHHRRYRSAGRPFP